MMLTSFHLVILEIPYDRMHLSSVLALLATFRKE